MLPLYTLWLAQAYNFGLGGSVVNHENASASTDWKTSNPVDGAATKSVPGLAKCGSGQSLES